MQTIALRLYFLPALAAGASLLFALAACGDKQAAKPPEKITTITVAQVATRDLPDIESAVGAETAIGLALDYDPTRVGGNTLYVRLPFPEHVAVRLKPGQTVQLSSFANPEKTVAGKIREIRPALDSTTYSREVVVAVSGGWRPVGSVRGEVILGTRKNALVVPEQAVVLRPTSINGNGATGAASGGTPGVKSVVYTIEGDVARERVVQQGARRDGELEITSGLKPGDTVAVDGANLLTDGAKIKVRESAAAKPPA